MRSSWPDAPAGRVQQRQEPPAQSVEIECLLVRKHEGVPVALKNTPQVIGSEIAVMGLGVVGHEVPQQPVVVALKRARGLAVVPEEGDPAGRLEDAREFGARLVEVEPVERLRDGHRIHARRRQRRLFRAAVDTVEARVSAVGTLGRGSHGRVRLDGKRLHPCASSEAVEIPVPDPTSAMTERDDRPATRRTVSKSSSGYPGR